MKWRIVAIATIAALIAPHLAHADIIHRFINVQCDAQERKATVVNVVTWNDDPAPGNGFVALAKIPHLNGLSDTGVGLPLCPKGDLSGVTIKAAEDADHPKS